MAEGHIRQRSAGSWELKFDLGRDPATGRRITKTATVRGTKRDAQRELRNRLLALDENRFADPGKMTVADWLREWLNEAEHAVAPKTFERYREMVEGHLVPGLGAQLLGKLQAVHIQSYYSTALKSGRRDGKGGLSAQTVRHLDRVLNVALKRARALRLIAVNPVEDVTRPKVERREVEHLEPADAKKLMDAARGTRLFSPVFLALATGLRRGELLGLRWLDVDLNRAKLTVNQSLEQTKDGLRFKAPKTKRSRRAIALSPSAVEQLKQHRSRQAEERLSLGLGKDPNGLVFTRLDGSPISPRDFTKSFSRLVAKAKVPAISLHGLRHTHFTNLLREGIHPKIASERAGHASVAITLDIYSHAVPGLQEDAAMRIDAGLADILGERGGNPVANEG